jgi:heme/copper-type cytochrome/quinol oxidase subunit 3
MVSCKCYGPENLERIKQSGGAMLWVLTILQLGFFVVYSICFTLMYNEDESVPSNHFLSASDWYRWIAILTLEVGSVFFLYKSIAVKEKNPNELFSYMTLTILLNVFFIYKLILDTIDIHNRIYGGPTTMTTLTFTLAIIGAVGCAIVIVFVFMTILPLREGIYEEIFWQIGGNQNVLANHKARTQFVAALEIDFFVIFEFCLTVGFYCYDLGNNYKAS